MFKNGHFGVSKRNLLLTEAFYIEVLLFRLVYDRNHLFGLGSDTETETENWPKLLADTETNRNHKILNWKALYYFMSCQLLSTFNSVYH